MTRSARIPTFSKQLVICVAGCSAWLQSLCSRKSSSGVDFSTAKLIAVQHRARTLLLGMPSFCWAGMYIGMLPQTWYCDITQRASHSLKAGNNQNSQLDYASESVSVPSNPLFALS